MSIHVKIKGDGFFLNKKAFDNYRVDIETKSARHPDKWRAKPICGTLPVPFIKIPISGCFVIEQDENDENEEFDLYYFKGGIGGWFWRPPTANSRCHFQSAEGQDAEGRKKETLR